MNLIAVFITRLQKVINANFKKLLLLVNTVVQSKKHAVLVNSKRELLNHEINLN